MFCEYYQAVINVPTMWFIGGVLRNEDNLVFERTVDGSSNVLEFFVPKDQEDALLDLLNHLISLGHVFSFEKKENRIKRESLRINNSNL